MGPDVKVLATFRGEPVAVRSGAMVGASFHPELTPDSRPHAELVGSAMEQRGEQGERVRAEVEDLLALLVRDGATAVVELLATIRG